MRLHTTMVGILLSCMFVLTMLVSGAAAQDDEIENIVPNPDFLDGTNGWTISGGFGVLSVDNKEESPTGTPVLMATINSVGAENWEPEIHSPSFPLKNGETYTYSFWAKAEEGSNRTLGPALEQLETYVSIGQGITLTDQWVEYHYTGIWTHPTSPPQVVIHIGFQLQTDDVWFSHFRVYEGEYVEEEIDEGPKIAVTPAHRLTTTWGKIKNR